MDIMNFGQPVGGIIQTAYVVEDIEAGIREYSDLLHIGPWHIRGPFTTDKALYRGEPTRLEVTLASSFAGHMMIELIQQHNDVPSVFGETIAKRGYGFHHWAIGSKDFDTTMARYRDAGFETAFYSESLGHRVAYMDATPVLPGMIEIVEMTEANEARYTKMYEASRDWDGETLIAAA